MDRWATQLLIFVVVMGGVVIYLRWAMRSSHFDVYGRRLQTHGDVPSVYAFLRDRGLRELSGHGDRVALACLPWTGPVTVDLAALYGDRRRWIGDTERVRVVGVEQYEGEMAAREDGTIERETHWRAFGYPVVVAKPPPT